MRATSQNTARAKEQLRGLGVLCETLPLADFATVELQVPWIAVLVIVPAVACLVAEVGSARRS